MLSDCPDVTADDPTNAVITTEDGWRRRGSCNGCGWCCQGIGWAPVALRGAADEAYLKLRGFVKRADGTHVARVLVLAPCREHDAKGQTCRIYHRRPQTCRTFPTHPDQIADSPCTYWFERDTKGESE